MATGRERRAERLNERLRGAQRVNVDSDDFDLNIVGIAQPFGNNAAQSSSRQNTSSPTITKLPSAIPQIPPPSSSPRIAQIPPGYRSSPSIRPTPEIASSPALPRRNTSNLQEEITESPINAPGSGHRRPVPVGALSATTSRLQNALVATSDGFPVSSSPLVRKVRQSDASQSTTRSRMQFVQAPSDDSEEEEPAREDTVRPVQVPSRQQPIPRSRPRPSTTLPTVSESPEAEEIDNREAARAIGLKRPRPEYPSQSPVLGSSTESSSPSLVDDPVPAPPPPKRLKVRSPAVQRQPQKRGRKAGRPPRAGSERSHTSRRSGSGEDGTIEVTVQRFVNMRDRRPEEDEDDGNDSSDPLQDDIPFANKKGETVVDVLAQVCDEVIVSTLGQFQYLVDRATDEEKKKECRIKMRAIEAYREELNSRLLQHAIHLNHWHSLHERLQNAQKQKLELREQILEIKAEREQVALSMDAVRIKHERDAKDSKHILNASTAMFDIDLAIEQGRHQPELSDKEQKQADITNLGLEIAKVAEQTGPQGSSGGMLSKLREFNAFLERAAMALESR